MLTRRIFLASSNELKEDRIAFELMLSQLNQEWVPRGTFFHLVVWENFIDAMRARKVIERAGGRVAIVNPQPAVRKVLDIVKAIPAGGIF